LEINFKYSFTYDIDSSKWVDFARLLNAAISEMANLREFEYMAIDTAISPRGTVLGLIGALKCPLPGVAFRTNFVLNILGQNILNSISAIHFNYLIPVEALISDLPLTSITHVEILSNPLRMNWTQFKLFVDKFRDVKITQAGRECKFDVTRPENIAELREEYGTDDWDLIIERCRQEQPLIKYAGKTE
jgi:hypothetical protein